MGRTPLVIYHHIPKTGGTSLRRLARANYGRGQLVDLDKPGGKPARWHRSTDWKQILDSHGEYYRSLSAEQRERIRCFVGHSAPYLIPWVKDRPVRSFCMLRDPVELVISHYLFTVWEVDHLGVQGPGSPMLATMRERGWSLGDVYRHLGDSQLPAERRVPFLPLFNIQARHLLLGTRNPIELPFASDGDALKGHLEAASGLLSNSYVVGTQDRFSESVRLFADSFGWRRVFVPHVNPGRLRSRAAEIDEEARQLIRAYNSVDAELHAHHSRLLGGMPATGRITDLHGRARLRIRGSAAKVRRRLRRRAIAEPR